MIFKFFEQQEKLNTAMDVINSDRRTQNLYNAKHENHRLKKVVATLIAMLVVGLAILSLPKYKDTPDGKRMEEQRRAAESHVR